MARIRTVKPELAAHEGMFDLEEETGLPVRFAWVMLFTVADREGRFPWRPRTLKAGVLPLDNVDFSQVLNALERAGFIVRYEVDGEAYGCIPTWSQHQSVNVRESASKIPPPPENMNAQHKDGACTLHDEHTPNGVNIPGPIRQTVFARDGNKCVRCGALDDLTIDHIFPRSIGGNHSLKNLRTLCRPCNSGRPVAGQGLIDDLQKDGLSLDDMQSTCMHVHARGEGKGREGKGKESTRDKHAQQFDELWKSWPEDMGEKGNRKRALDQWCRLKPTPELEAEIRASLDQQVLTKRELRSQGQFAANFQHVERWIRDRGWESHVGGVFLEASEYIV